MEERNPREESKATRALLAATILISFMLSALFVLPGLKRMGERSLSVVYNPVMRAADARSWSQAVEKIKEDRGEPVGKDAKVSVPSQLRHYSDTRRFLAVQVAESLEHRLENPRDFVDLAAMIKKGELVELKPVGENYVLFGVGGNADEEPFTRYENGKRIALYNGAELDAEYARIALSNKNIESDLAGLKQELASASRRERSLRATLQTKINEKEKSLKALRERKDLLDEYYGTPERREQLLADDETIESLAHDFSGRAYRIEDEKSRREMKARMLSFLRPEALKVLDELAASYRQKFDRPLPVTSLVRPEEYQHELSKVNPNATRIATPPHSTGLAFDILYKYMTAEEQSFVMAELARLKDEGRIEVLRENRNHYHVFAFIDGERPAENFIAESLGKPRERQVEKESPSRVMESQHATPKRAEKSSKKEGKAKERRGREKKRR